MKIIIAIDDSPYSQKVIESVAKRQWPDTAQFKILTVLEPVCVEPEDNGDFKELLEQVYHRRRESAHKLLNHARDQLLKVADEGRVHFEIREGIPKHEIVDCAVEWNADKIMLGAHGHGICPHNVIGGVSRNVAATAPCTVEIVRPRQDSHKGHAAKSGSAVVAQ